MILRMIQELKASSLLSVIGNSVIGYFGNLYLRGEKNEMGKEGVFTNLSDFFWLPRVFVPVLFQTSSQSGLCSVLFHLSYGIALSNHCLYSVKVVYVQLRTL